jgi:hypothetical protein
MPWSTDYAGDVIFRRVNGNVLEEPLRRFDDLQEGLTIWVPSPSGRAYEATVLWDSDGGFYWRCGSTVGWLAFSEDERGCWVCTGAARQVLDD